VAVARERKLDLLTVGPQPVHAREAAEEACHVCVVLCCVVLVSGLVGGLMDGWVKGVIWVGGG
jgi:hypothetical protein